MNKKIIAGLAGIALSYGALQACEDAKGGITGFSIGLGVVVDGSKLELTDLNFQQEVEYNGTGEYTNGYITLADDFIAAPGAGITDAQKATWVSNWVDIHKAITDKLKGTAGTAGEVIRGLTDAGARGNNGGIVAGTEIHRNKVDGTASVKRYVGVGGSLKNNKTRVGGEVVLRYMHPINNGFLLGAEVGFAFASKAGKTKSIGSVTVKTESGSTLTPSLYLLDRTHAQIAAAAAGDKDRVAFVKNGGTLAVPTGFTALQEKYASYADVPNALKAAIGNTYSFAYVTTTTANKTLAEWTDAVAKEFGVATTELKEKADDNAILVSGDTSVEIKHKSFMPSFAVVGGGMFNGWFVGLRAGVINKGGSVTDFKTNGAIVKDVHKSVNKWHPLLGVQFAKNIDQTFYVYGKAEYHFSSGKKSISNGTKTFGKLKNKGWNIAIGAGINLNQLALD